MITSCVVSSVHGTPEKLFVKRGVDIYRCGSCGCIMGDLEFDHEQYESDDYYTLGLTKRQIEEEWGFRWRYILGKLNGRTILDIGAGNGYFVALAGELGFEATGTEISRAERQFAQATFGVQLLAEPPAENYDAVAAFNVIEHVPEPARLLGDMASRLAPGGQLVLTTPNPNCIHRRVKGLQNWGMVDPPHHINLFTREALTEMLAGLGFRIARYETLSTYVRFVRKYDTRSLHLRRSVCSMLRWAGWGADHFLIAQR